MDSVERIINGKQVGVREIRFENGVEVYYDIGVQKWKDKYKIYSIKIESSQIAFFDDISDEVEKVVEFDSIEEVIHYFNNVICIDIDTLHPLKGNKIFNPEF